MNQRIIIRNVQIGDDEGVWKVAKTLSVPERYIFYYLGYKKYKTNALVAVNEGRIVGCSVPKVFTIGGEKMGTINAIFVDRSVQGKGVGRFLIDATLAYFQKVECQTLYYIVDRFNSPSWNIAMYRGFNLFELNEQFRVLGWKIFSLWWATSYFFTPGLFILRKKGKESQIAREASPMWHFFLAWFGFSFVFWIGSNMRGATPWLNFAPFVFGVIGISIFIHETSHKVIARFFGFRTIFKVWESGLIFSAFWALLGGILLPFYGSTFIRKKDWEYSNDIQKMGLIYATGPTISLLLTSFFLFLTYWTNVWWIISIGIIGFWANFAIVLSNLIPVFPFISLDGRKIFLWNKTVWSLLVLWLVSLLYFKVLLSPYFLIDF